MPQPTPPDVEPAEVAVDVTVLWAAPDSPRPVDAAVTADVPDVDAWLARLDEGDDDAGRLGLHGRAESQLVAGEPVVVVGTDGSGGWSQVRAPWQPSPKSAAGYPGWVPTAHLRRSSRGEYVHPRVDVGPPQLSRRGDGSGDAEGVGDTSHPAIGLARQHLGLRYLWGGLTPAGFDCSGLVHHVWRRFGIVVPRDAYAQAEFADPVELDDVRPGDLYFFAHPGQRIHHVGIVVESLRMVHASETGRVLVDEMLPPTRVETLVSAGRLPRP